MNMKDGRTFESIAAGMAAGVPENDLASLAEERDAAGALVYRVETKGPFKGRIYRRNDLGQMVRQRDEERRLRSASR